MKGLFYIVLTVPILSGCATYFEQSGQTKCVSTEWYVSGFDAAKVGQNRSDAWAELDSDCSTYNIWSDRQSFNRGYNEGVTKFCTRSNGFEFGQRNLGYDNICPTSSQAEFDQAYADGQSLYNTNYNMEYAIDYLADAQITIERCEERRRYLAKLIDSDTLDKDTAKKYVKERYKLKHEISSAKSSLSGYRSDITHFSRELASLEHQFFQQYYGDLEQSPKRSGYSAQELVSLDKIEINEPAILLYKPEHMDPASKRHYRDMAKQINKYVSLTVDRSFRYQVVGDTEIVFNSKSKGNSKTRVQPYRDYRQPTLLFWDGQNQLTDLELASDKQQPPLAELARFIQLTASDKIITAASNE